MQRRPTEKQGKIIHEKSGLFTVRACPGSGKTFTVATRLHRLLSEWPSKNQGIATISFTNVAWQEIEDSLISDFSLKSAPGYPHFLGTIDKFINTYIFLPFGHLVMGCPNRPILTGPPHDNHEPIGNWLWWGNNNAICNQKGCRLNQFTYSHEGRLIHLNYPNMGENCPHNPNRPCIRHKKTFNVKGYATQADANYFALKILQNYPHVADALAVRFPVIMIDEAQDTSEIQMCIIDLLIKHGVQEMMLVGDPDQAIYEWREAEPHLFLEKCKEWKENSVNLSENWRSSQRICDFASEISSSTEKMLAANPIFTNDGVSPEIWGYSSLSDLPTLKSNFIEYCKGHEISESKATILTRSQELLNDIRPGTVQPYSVDPWNDPISRDFARGKYLYDNENFGEAFRIFQKALCKHSSGKNIFDPTDLVGIYNKIGFGNWRATLFELLNSLPITDRNLSQWISETNIILKGNSHFRNLELKVKENSTKCRYKELSFEEAFGRQELVYSHSECYLGTVHSVKGKSLDAVMFVLKKKAGRSFNYVNLLDKDIQSNEELRIVYVAISRAKHLLVIAVPSEDVNRWKQKFRSEHVCSAQPSQQ